MQKQDRNQKKKFSRLKARKKKNLIFLKRLLKYKTYKISPYSSQLFSLRRRRRFSRIISIRVTSNNVFCSLKDNKKNKTLFSCSSGKYKIKITRKRLRFGAKIVVNSFLKEIKQKIKLKNLIVLLVSPIKIRKTLLIYLSDVLKHRSLILKIKEKKCFNGCRPSKKKRKKRKGLRIFK